tara:strand:- start:2651 stop:2884 length:234 start_codon:yes stop_codon:yes gene_type:complete
MEFDCVKIWLLAINRYMTLLPPNFQEIDGKLTVDLRQAEKQEIIEFMSVLLQVKASLPELTHLYLKDTSPTRLESWT